MPADAAGRSVWFFCTLALASAADLRRQLIPNTFCILTAVAGLIAISPARFVGQILGPLAALPFLGVALIFPDRAGGGDIKFVASVGFVLGLLPTLWGGILGLSLAIVYAAARACIEKHCAATPTPIGQIAIPLAPFLSIGFAIFYVLEVIT